MGLWRALVTPEITADTPEGAALQDKVGAAANIHHRRVHEMIGVEFGYSYAGSDLVAYEPDNITDWDTTVYTAHTRPGVRIPHIWLNDGRAIQDALGDDYNFLDLTGRRDTSALEAEFSRLGAPLRVVRLDDGHVRREYESSLLLLRPDLHIFWRGDELPEQLAALAGAAVGWASGAFNAPAADAQQQAVTEQNAGAAR
jgi:hypothetical protein